MNLLCFWVVIFADITVLYSVKESVYIVFVQNDAGLIPVLILSIIAMIFFTVATISIIAEYFR